jgi:hypothetical protein
MLKTYEVNIENGQIIWLEDKPGFTSAHAYITILEENLISDSDISVPKRKTPAHLIGQAKTIGDIVSPIVDEEDWECLK